MLQMRMSLSLPTIMPTTLPAIMLLAIMSLTLTACSSSAPRSGGSHGGGHAPSRLSTPAPAHEQDGYPDADDVPDDLAAVPEPVPREEPKSKYGNPETYTVLGETYRVRPSAENFVERGVASWYGTKFHGRRTSSGEAYDMYKYTAAHKTLPLPSYVQVTNLSNGQSTVVRVNDRGPFKAGRIIDLSYVAAHKLGLHNTGTAPVEIRVLTPGERQAELASTPAPGRATPSAPASGAGSGTSPAAVKAPTFFVQAGAFGDAHRARQRAELVRPMTSETVAVQTGQNGRLHRVRIGPLATRALAEALLETLDTRGVEAAIVVD